MDISVAIFSRWFHKFGESIHYIIALIIPPLYADYVYEDKLSALKRFM